METTPPNPQPAQPLGRLFVVPLLIVVAMIACSALVVLLFGAISSPMDLPVTDLLARLEAADGSRKAGMLLPRDKELWQAASELAMRLDNVADEVSAEELPELQSRLARLLERDIADLDQRPDTARQAVYFTMLAAAKAGSDEAVPLLVEAAVTGDTATQMQALKALAEMASVPAARRAGTDLVVLLQSSAPEIQMVTCVVLANIATAEDAGVTAALLAVCSRVDHDAEVRWNAAMALARLGFEDPGGVVVAEMIELLDRGFWDSRRVQYTSTSGNVDRAFTEPEKEQLLLAAIGAAEHLSDQRVWVQLRTLADDPSLRVAGAARIALDRFEEEDPAKGS